MRRIEIPTRSLQRLALAFATFLLMTAGVPSVFTSTALGQDRQGGLERPPFRTAQNQDERAVKRLYDRVMQEFNRKDYEAALAGYRFFLELYGNTRFAPSARYWAGECEYRLGRYEEAIESFSVVLKVSRQQPKLAGATLKMALAYEKLGHTDASRILFERVLSEFAGMPEVAVAKRHLGPSTPDPLHLEMGATTSPAPVDRLNVPAASP